MDWDRGKIPFIEVASWFDWLPAESRIKTLQAGVTSQHRWSDADWMMAQQISHLQTMVRLLWVGLGIQGDPPKHRPVMRPTVFTPETEADRQKRLEYAAKVAALRDLRPPPLPRRSDR